MYAHPGASLAGCMPEGFNHTYGTDSDIGLGGDCCGAYGYDGLGGFFSFVGKALKGVVNVASSAAGIGPVFSGGGGSGGSGAAHPDVAANQRDWKVDPATGLVYELGTDAGGTTLAWFQGRQYGDAGHLPMVVGLRQALDAALKAGTAKPGVYPVSATGLVAPIGVAPSAPGGATMPGATLIQTATSPNGLFLLGAVAVVAILLSRRNK